MNGLATWRTGEGDDGDGDGGDGDCDDQLMSICGDIDAVSFGWIGWFNGLEIVLIDHGISW